MFFRSARLLSIVAFAFSTLLITSAAAHQPRVPAPHKHALPALPFTGKWHKPAVLRSMVGGLWMIDGNLPQPTDVTINRDVLVKNQPVLRIFLDVLRGTGVNGGFAEIAGCSDLPQGSLKLKHGVTVRGAMDALVARNPGYQWELENGVVVLRPRVGIPLLNTQIRKFQMNATERETPAVLQALLRLAEVQAHAAQLDLKPALGQGGPGVYEEHPIQREAARFHAGWQNFSLLDGLNRIVQTSRRAVWIYRETDCGGDKTYSDEMATDYGRSGAATVAS